MFKTYTQAMAHLLYGNIKSTIEGSGKLLAGSKEEGLKTKTWEAAKTTAGLIVGTSIFTGLYGAAAIEPLRLAVYAYHKLFDEEGEVYDLKNSMHHWLVEHLGDKAGELAASGLPHAIGWDLSSRMGLSDLFFHEMPDLLTNSKDNWKNFIYGESGTMTSFLAGTVTNFYTHMQKGEPFQAISSAIPIKQWQDTVKAIELGTTGKMNSIGGQMTQPSAWDATTQFLGIKPASVANTQEKTGAAIEYKNAIKAQKDSIIKDYVSSKDKSRALNRILQFNKNAPGEAIKVSDLNSLMNARAMEEAGVSKDPEINRRTSF
jgi:hypothetical protein